MVKIGKYEIDKIETRRSKGKWVAWLSASFARIAEWYNEAKCYPERYKTDSDIEFAKMAMERYVELWKLDKDCAKMIGSSWNYLIAEMTNTLGEEGKKYFKYLTY